MMRHWRALALLILLAVAANVYAQSVPMPSGSGSGSGGAPTDAEYWVGAANGSLSAEKNLGALATGLVLNTAGTPSAYAGTSCTNQFPRSLNASGAATCASVSLSADVTGNLPVTNLNSGTSAGATTFWRGDGTWATPATSGDSITTTAVKTANYTASCFERIPVNATGGAFTVTLPAATTNPCPIEVKLTGTTNNAITVARAGSDTIDDGATSDSLIGVNTLIGYAADGTSKWYRY